jgi:ubiquinone/menaquinone biosynthesis C-methylase UbiE
MSRNKHIQLFDSIARPYGWFYRPLLRRYLDLLHRHLQSLDLDPGSRVLDVGCGPGSFGLAFELSGFEVTGVDSSRNMVSIAVSNGLDCVVADAAANLPFPDRSFDLVIAGYVAHGIPKEQRSQFFLEMNRVAMGGVLLHDFSPALRGFSPFSIVGILERLERSDYIDFRQNGFSELEGIFESVSILPIDKRLCWYFCRRGALA